ncbi:MAG: family 20 glycosylhydrolase [Planctomycetes bacterium]|nr:family 20 glycosylhydrolase [Planctomycetota bacterium]
MHAFRAVSSSLLVAISIFAQPLPPVAAASATDEPAIIPRPTAIEPGVGSFTIRPDTALHVQAEAAQPVAAYLADHIAAATGIRLAPKAGPADAGAGNVIFLAIAAGEGGNESYELRVSETRVELRAPSPAGLFRGVQTIRQLLPLAAAAASAPAEPAPAQLAAVRIADSPRYPWRGMLLDCGRHFVPKDMVKRYIDLLAYHKMNVLHWHLTEDQGWRIEIKKFPKLTEVGAWRTATRDSEQPRDGQNRYGGFYTQDDIREIVAYAQSRFITVVPEIELPGHCRAALAAYPEYSCTGGPFKVRTDWGVEDDVYCAGSDKTFDFLQAVLTEVIELFPSPCIHIGGDECPKARWKNCPICQQRIKAEGRKDERELQSYFVRRIEKFLNEKGRRLIGWDEILEGGLAPNATVQSWRGMEGAIAAASADHDVISSPTSHCYIDYSQGAGIDEPRLMGFVPLERCYQFEPTPESLPPEKADHILGLEGNLWTEHAPPALLDRQAFPRLLALAEVGWTAKQRRDWPDFQRRLKSHYPRLDALGVNYYVPTPTFKLATGAAGPNGEFDPASLTAAGGVTAITDKPRKLVIQANSAGEIRFTVDGSNPTADSPKYAGPIDVADSAIVRARSILPTGNAGAIGELRFVKVAPLDPTQATAGEAGVAVDVYKGTWKQLPDFSKLTPAASTVLPGTETDPVIRENAIADLDTQFALRFRGLFKAPTEGLYTFALRSDDGSRLTIGATVVADNDGEHPVRQAVGYAWLRAGYHALTVEYFQGIGGRKLELLVDGPGMKAGPITGASLFVEKK